MPINNFDWQPLLADSLLGNDLTKDLLSGHWQIYRNNVKVNLIEALAATYPFILKLIGEPCFKKIAEEYMKTYPSCDGDLNKFGEHFSSLLSTHPATHTLKYLTEMAELEWTCHQIFLESEPAPLNIAALLNLNAAQQEQLHLDLHPASQIFAFQYPILRIIQLCKAETEQTIDLNEGGVYLLVIRRNLEVFIEHLNFAEFTFLKALQEKNTLTMAYQKALLINPDFPLTELLIKWVKEKTITQFVLSV